MTGWLLDTNVLSELGRPRPDARVLTFIAAQPLDQLFTSTVVLAEISCGIIMQEDAAKKADLQQWLDQALRPMMAGKVLEVTEAVMLKWCLLDQAGRKVGHTYSQPDLIIAATALEHGLTIVTRNIKDFQRTGAVLLNPWLEP